MTEARTLHALKSENNHLNIASRLKGAGYLTSSVSVGLLAIPGLKSALESPFLALCLFLGMATSVCGMFLRWRSHRQEQQEKAKFVRKDER